MRINAVKAYKSDSVHGAQLPCTNYNLEMICDCHDCRLPGRNIAAFKKESELQSGHHFDGLQLAWPFLPGHIQHTLKEQPRLIMEVGKENKENNNNGAQLPQSYCIQGKVLVGSFGPMARDKSNLSVGPALSVPGDSVLPQLTLFSYESLGPAYRFL